MADSNAVVKYSLEHLTQADDQRIIGPIQDDEALFLFALIKCMMLRTIVEIGGLAGYSAQNFLAAAGPEGQVFTIDLSPVPKIAANHHVIIGDAAELDYKALGINSVDMIFFDCHDVEAQMRALDKFFRDGVADDSTLICLHDTNCHPQQIVPWAYETADGWVHQTAERTMVNLLHTQGYDAICLDTRMDRHDPSLPYRHGLTLMRRFRPLAVRP